MDVWIETASGNIAMASAVSNIVLRQRDSNSTWKVAISVMGGSASNRSATSSTPDHEKASATSPQRQPCKPRNELTRLLEVSCCCRRRAPSDSTADRRLGFRNGKSIAPD